MGLGLTPLQTCLATTLLAAFAIWLPLRMNDIMIPHNEACYGPFSDAQYRALLTLRLQTWAASLFATGLAIVALCWLNQGRKLRLALIIAFVIWKAATLFHDVFGSPICWESYANDAPFWDEPFGTGFAFYLQPLAFATLSILLLGLVGFKWLALLKNT